MVANPIRKWTEPVSLKPENNPLSGSAEERGRVLTKAVLNTAERLQLNDEELGVIIGVDPSGIAQMRRKELFLKEGAKSFELAVLLVRLYRSLYALMGGDENAMCAWIRVKNSALGDVPPVERIRRVTGLVDVVAYLDSRRAVV